MNRTTATCIAGMRSKTTSRIRIHFFPRPFEATPFTRVRPRGRSVLRGFAVGIFAKRLRWRPEHNPLFSRGPADELYRLLICYLTIVDK